MPHSYADTWAALPPDLQDRFGNEEPFTAAEWSRLIRAGVPSSPHDGSWVLAGAFREWVIRHLDTQADNLGQIPERVAIGKVPLDHRNRDNDPPPLDEETARRADSLRERARRLRDG
jgi:cytosine/adenosine deaminase-related metal-dependent hydrolase